jgi:hypothetical protein
MTDVFERLKVALSNRYSVKRALGGGGIAKVYLSEELELHSKVALKVLKADLAAALGNFFKITLQHGRIGQWASLAGPHHGSRASLPLHATIRSHG